MPPTHSGPLPGPITRHWQANGAVRLPLHTHAAQFGTFVPPAHRLIRLGEGLNQWFSKLRGHAALKRLFPGTTSSSPLFKLNLKETLPAGLGLLLLLYIHGQQKNKANQGQPFDPNRSLKLAGEAALSHGLLATTKYVYPALGLATWAYTAGKEPTLVDKLSRGLKIMLSMAALATGSYLGMGYTLNQTRQDINKVQPLLTPSHLAQWDTALSPWWRMAAPEHVSAERWADMQRQAKTGWRQFLHRAQTSLDDPITKSSTTGTPRPPRPAGMAILATFDNTLQQAQRIPSKYRARQHVINAFNHLYQGLHPLEHLRQERPDTPFPKTLQELTRKLATVNRPYVRLSRFLTPIAFGVILNQLVATPLHKVLSGGMRMITPQFIQQARARVYDELGWLDFTPSATHQTTPYGIAPVSTPLGNGLWQNHFQQGL